jgi:4-amino-4-deoxy-L-arabinose transferase-like glycosyltransferase
MAATTDMDGRQNVAARGLTGVLDFATRSHGRAMIVLVVAALLNILPGFFTIPPTDRDEARFAEATKQMLETHDYIDIRFQDEVRYKKPVGIYWMQALAVKAGKALGVRNALTTIWLYRLPSLFGALSAVLLIYWTALAFVTHRAAVLAGLMMATCILLSFEGRIAKTDAALLASVVAAMGALARAYLPEQRKWLGPQWPLLLPAIFWTALAAGVLLKGPVIVMVTALTAVALVAVDRSAAWLKVLRPLPGIAWFALLVLPWFLAIIMRSGDTFFVDSVGQDMVAKLFSGQESHGAPFGYYFILFWITFWPGATLAAMAAPAVWAARREPGAKFLLAWIVPSWFVFELIMTKLPHYVLPVYPAVAILIGGFADARMLSSQPWLKRGAIWWFLVPLLVGIVGVVGLLVIGRHFGLLVWPVIGASAVMGLLAWQLYDADGAGHSLLRGAAAAILTTTALFGLVIPALPQLFPSKTLAVIMRQSGCPQPLAASAGYHEPSLVFLAGSSTRLTDAAGAADFLSGGDCRFAFIEARQERAFAQQAESIGLHYSPGGRIDAINMASGRPITIAVYRSTGGP